jgi:hypothetical protein
MSFTNGKERFLNVGFLYPQHMATEAVLSNKDCLHLPKIR